MRKKEILCVRCSNEEERVYHRAYVIYDRQNGKFKRIGLKAYCGDTTLCMLDNSSAIAIYLPYIDEEED